MWRASGHEHLSGSLVVPIHDEAGAVVGMYGATINVRVSASLREIVGGARKADELVAQIAVASKEQSQGIAQLNLAMGRLDELTQRNAASAQESANVSTELRDESSRFTQSMFDLQALVGSAQQVAQ